MPRRRYIFELLERINVRCEDREAAVRVATSFDSTRAEFYARAPNIIRVNGNSRRGARSTWIARLTYLKIKQIPSLEDWQSPGCKRLIDRELSS